MMTCSCVLRPTWSPLGYASLSRRQPNTSSSVDVHYSEAARAKTLVDELLDELANDKPGLWVRSVPVKEKDGIKRKASNDYDGEVRR